MTDLPSVIDSCRPRAEILSGNLAEDLYMADLGLVAQGNGPEAYQDPSAFFRNTYPTEGLRTVAREVFTRLSGKGPGSPVIRLETSLGGGKTHTLIALYHLSSKPEACEKAAVDILEDTSAVKARVAVLIGTDPSLTPSKEEEPRTLWGHLGRALGKWGPGTPLWESDRARVAPGKSDLQEVLRDGPTLILVDELAEYLLRAAAISVGERSTLADQTGPFLQELTQAVASLPRVCLVITSLRVDDPFSEGTKEIHHALEKSLQRAKAVETKVESQAILSRLERPITPTGPTEFAAVVRHRLFEGVNMVVAKQVAQAYASALQRPEVRDRVLHHAVEPGYMVTLEETYPFHPELIQILRTKTSSIASFNQTRGVLRLLTAVVRSVWKDRAPAPLIHPFHVDLKERVILEELVSRLNKGEYRPALTADLIDPKGTPRVTLVDEGFTEPWGTRLLTTTFLHSLTGYVAAEVRRGATEPELMLGCYRPDDDPKILENALRSLEETCFYFVRSGPYFVLSTEPSLNLVVKNAQDLVRDTIVREELEDRVIRLFGGRQFFEPCIFANEPSKVPDDTSKPKLVVIHFGDATAKLNQGSPPPDVLTIYTQSGSQGKPRLYRNNLVFLVADYAEVDRMKVKIREYLALKSLLTPSGAGASGSLALSPTQRETLETRRKECDLYAKVSIVLSYRHIYVPSTSKEAPSGLRHLVIRATDADVTSRLKQAKSEEQYLVDFLVGQEVARKTDSPLSSEFVLEDLWPKNQEVTAGDEFKKLFYTHPSANLHFSEDLIAKTLRSGLEKGVWYIVADGKYFDHLNAIQFPGGFQSSSQVVLSSSGEGRRLWSEYNCPTCGKRRTSCTCSKRVQVCENCGLPLHEGACTSRGPSSPPGEELTSLTVHGLKLERAASELAELCKDRRVETITGVDLQAKQREGLLKLSSAFPQLPPSTVSLDIQAALDREYDGGNLLEIRYRGNLNGFNAIKSVVANYDARLDLDRKTLIVKVRFSEPQQASSLVEVLRSKLGPFTEETLFDVTLVLGSEK